MASSFTELLGQGGLWGSLMDVGRDLGQGWRDWMGKDGAIRDWWTADTGLPGNFGNLRSGAKLYAGSALGAGIDDYTGGNWGGAAVSGLRGLGNLGSGSGGLGSMGGLGGLGGMLGGNAQMPPVDNSMILPQPPQRQESGFPPGLLTMLLANAMRQQIQQPQQPEASQSISGGGTI